MSALLTTDMCVKAWRVVLPSILAAASDGVIRRRAGTIVVLDPAFAFAPSLRVRDGDSRPVLFMESVDPEHEESPTFDRIAFAKAQLSWRTGRSSRDIQQNAPHLYEVPLNRERGDVKWGGSVVREGLVVAFSGVQANFDEWIAGMMADLLLAMCRDEMVKPGGLMENRNSYIPVLAYV